MRTSLCTFATIVSLLFALSPVRSPLASAAPVQGSAVRILGPRGETTPVVNENNQLQLRVDGAGSVSRWTSDSPDVATVSRTGVLAGKLYGFATISAETASGTARVIAVVARKTPRRAARAQGDTKTDTGGNVYLSSPFQHVVYRSDGLSAGVFAGAVGEAGYEVGQGTEARFNIPTGLGVDQSARGGVYVADTANHCIRRIRQNGSVEVVAGLPEHEGRMVADRTPMSEAVLTGPRGVVVVGGNLMVADTQNHCIWYLDLERSEVRLVAGEPGESGSGTANGRGRQARFNRPSGLAVSTNGRLVAVADTGNNVIRLIGVGVESGEAVYDVTTLGLASSRRGAEVSRLWREDRGEDALSFDAPESVSIDGVGNIYVIDAASAVVVTRREDAVERVELAQFGTLGDPASVTLSGTQAFVLDAAAASDETVNVVEVGPPKIDALSTEIVRLSGGDEVVIDGSNFAPETLVVIGDQEVSDITVESARRIRLRVPEGLSAPGRRTLSVITRGGVAQRQLTVRSHPLGELVQGQITTVAGGVRFIGDGGVASLSHLATPWGLALDGTGNLFIADADNHRIRRVDAITRQITTVAGTGEAGYDGDGTLAVSARVNRPTGITVDGAGNLLIADSENHRIRRVDATTGLITTVAGTGFASYDGDNKPATSAALAYPAGLAVDGTGSLFIADRLNSRIRRVDTTTGLITTVAGTGAYGYDGDGGSATSARLSYPDGLAVDGAGNLFTADTHNHRIRRVDAETGLITTVAGTGVQGYEGDGALAVSARLNDPFGVMVDAAGNLFVADTFNHRIRRVDAATGRITTLAGVGSGGYGGDGGPALASRLASPSAIALDVTGTLFIADTNNNRIRRVDMASELITTYAGTDDNRDNGDHSTASSASLHLPQGVTVDDTGNLFIADTDDHRIRRVDVATGNIETVAGTGEPGNDGDGGSATSARLSYPGGTAVDAAGNLFIADTYNRRVRRVDATGRITTVAGTGIVGYGGDGGPATSALLSFPMGVAVDGEGNLFIADIFNYRVRRVDATTGHITTVAGTGGIGYDGDDKPATAAQLSYPAGIAVDAAGNLFIADRDSHRIRRVGAETGVITTVAGTGAAGYDGDGGSATNARLRFPQGLAFDSTGNLFIGDSYNDRIRRVDVVTGLITTVAGSGVRGYAGDGTPATAARLNVPYGIALDAADTLYIADSRNHAIRAVRARGIIDGPLPVIDRIAFKQAQSKLILKGSSFGATGTVVTVNGTDVSFRIRKLTNAKIILRGSAEELGLQAGRNEITVTVGSRTSAVVVLTL